MRKRKKGYGIVMVLTIVFTVVAILTIIPDSSASKVSMLGYRAHCSFTPIGTIIGVVLAGITCSIRRRRFTE